MRVLTGLSLIAFMALLFPLVGCQHPPWQQGQQVGGVESDEESDDYEAPHPGLSLAPEQPFREVPIPRGLNYDGERSFIYERTGLEVGEAVYTTRHSVNELVEFFVRECAAAGWSLANRLQGEGAELAFEQSDRELRIAIRDGGFFQGRHVFLRVTPRDS
ncbi:MAG: hypothetical protein R6W89_04470 [Candidatus Hydrogenedentota bacterium]